MRRYLLLAPLLLTACAYGADYHPKLAKQPADEAKYEADRQLCFVEVDQRWEKAEPSDFNPAYGGVFGLVGGIAAMGVDQAVNEQEDDYHKTPMQMHDECMTAKGYKVIPQS